jgi:3',5'-cyclic AMP phosphodiesterase CpdA
MRVILHLSDLHFGRLDEAILPALHADILVLRPDLIAVSGDLTQRARRRQFGAARDFLRSLPFPRIVVPGNHDVPLYNVIARGTRPLARFRRYIGEDLNPFFADEEIAVAGINTARALTVKNGRINRRQVVEACTQLQATAPGAIRIVVTHHPFDLPEVGRAHDLVGRSGMAMAGFAGCRVDLFLSGHLHTSRIGHSAQRYKIAGYSALIVQAGTATSTRRRGEANAYNLIRIEGPRIAVDCAVWDHERGQFAVATTQEFRRGLDGWAAEEAASGDEREKRRA